MVIVISYTNGGTKGTPLYERTERQKVLKA